MVHLHFAVFAHTLRWYEMGWAVMSYADNSTLHFSGGSVHTVGDQRSPSHPSVGLCVNAPLHDRAI